jgi:hypothetical protein
VRILGLMLWFGSWRKQAAALLKTTASFKTRKIVRDAKCAPRSGR